MINVKYDTPYVLKTLSKVEVFIKYNILRPIISFILWKIKQNKENYFLDYNGKPLKEGISFCVPAYNEEHTISFCLESLTGFIDHLIFIDNGSTDNTIDVVRAFQAKYQDLIEVTVLEMPGATLIEMRQEALKYVHHKWFVRGDADMMFTEAFKTECKQIIDNAKRPIAIQISMFDLFGNVSHYHNRFGMYSNGEYYMRNFDSNVKYQEYSG